MITAYLIHDCGDDIITEQVSFEDFISKALFVKFPGREQIKYPFFTNGLRHYITWDEFPYWSNIENGDVFEYENHLFRCVNIEKKWLELLKW